MRQPVICFLSLILFVAVFPLSAQNDTLLALQSATPTLQTGQAYTVTIQLEAIQELWLADVDIQYDPDMLYIIGTASGQPVTAGDIFGAGSLTLDNRVLEDTVFYTASRVAPQDPFSGSGVLGNFQIFPLKAGTTQLSFRTAQMTKVNFVEQNGRRVGESTTSLPFTPVLLELTIMGDSVTPPPEFTATPTASPTLDPALLPAESTAAVEPTLVNVTAAPRPILTPTATPLTLLETPAAPNAAGSVPLIMLVAVGIIGLAVVGLGILAWLRRKKT
jgi:hypothetical protein